MKLNRKYLIESILEVMMEDDELSPRSDFEKLMSALTSDLSNARQALEMYDLGAYELTPEEDAKANKVMMDIEAREIVRDSLTTPVKTSKRLAMTSIKFLWMPMASRLQSPRNLNYGAAKTVRKILSLKATVGCRNGTRIRILV